ncbi:unnamed protein product [Rhizophagus irregularis]|uniref:Uncharacterized protein n=1 Tax=Rhizophagus irregularis TaxID=588596 RepID=A0A915YWY1_9GLOM|nr:unnamed protein product [Rhizophagus irregularis]
MKLRLLTINSYATALATEKSLTAFNITLVLDRIRRSLNLEPKQQLIILLHIDEYQEIIDFDNNGYWKIIFLLGTALRDITKKFGPSSCSFVFVECPLLSTTAIREIVDYYANENGDKQQGWMTSASFLQILYDTGRLPRALQYVLEKSLSTNNFFDQLKEGAFSFFNDIFNSVVETLNKKYCIRNFVQKNKNTSRQLLYHCICGIPVKLEQVLDIDKPHLTVEKLERDGYLI